MLASPKAKEELDDNLVLFRRCFDAVKRIVAHEIRHAIDTFPGIENVVEKAAIARAHAFIDSVYEWVKSWTH